MHVTPTDRIITMAGLDCKGLPSPPQQIKMILTTVSALLIKLDYYIFSVMHEYTLNQGAWKLHSMRVRLKYKYNEVRA